MGWPLVKERRKGCSTPEEVRAAFGEWLLRHGHCDAEAWEAVLALSGERGVLENSFYACNLDDARAARALAELSGLPFLSARRLRGAAERSSGLDAVRGTEMHQLLRRWHAVPLPPAGGRWPVAIADPTDAPTRAEIVATLGESVTFVVAPYRAITAVLDPTPEAGRAMDEAQKGLKDLAHLAGVLDAPDEPNPADTSPAARIVDALLATALSEGASVVHLDRVDGELRVRLSIHGSLHETMRVPRQAASPVLNRLETLARITPGNRSQPAEGWFEVTLDRRTLTLVVDSVPGREGRVATLRLYHPLPDGSLSGLGVTAEAEALLADPQGLFLIAGPTGSGRTRLLYTLAQRIDTGERDVLVLDRARRYPLPNASHPDCRAPEQVAEYLEMALRAGVDAVVVWEPPPGEVLRSLLQAASEGTAVLLRVPARDAAAGVERIARESGRPALLSRALTAAFGCRLLPHPCPACGEGSEPCPACRGRGTAGLVGFKEVLLPDGRVRLAIASGAAAPALRDTAIEAGMVPLSKLLRPAVEAGTVSCEAARRALAYR